MHQQSSKSYLQIVALLVLALLLIIGGWLLFRSERAPVSAVPTMQPSGTAEGSGDTSAAGASTSRVPTGTNPGTGSSARSADWEEKRRKTEDYFELVAAAVDASIAGDGKAAYVIAGALGDCVTAIHLAKISTDPEAAFRDGQRRSDDRYPAQPVWFKQLEARRFKRCIRLAKENPFRELPPRDGGYYSILYWVEEAVRLGDPVAKADQLGWLLNSSAEGAASEEKRAEFEKARAHLRDVVQSRDPRAIFNIGSLLINRRYSADLSRGLVLELAACEMGLDCSGQIPLVGRSRCEFVEECAPPVDHRELIKRDVGARDYARLYARAQDVVDLLGREDWDSLKQYMEIEGTLEKKYR